MEHATEAPAVRANINYLGRMAEEAYVYYREPPPGSPYTNIVDEGHPVDVFDARARLRPFSLEADGLVFLEHGNRFRDFDDDYAVRRAFYPEVERMFRDLLGLERVVAYDFAVRRPHHGPVRPVGIPVAGTQRRPILRAHGDFAVDSGAAKVRQLMGDEADGLLCGRFRAFNFWRPIQGPLTDAPLALCEPRTVVAEDLSPIRQLQEGRENYISGLHFNPAHRWWRLPAMAADEGVIFSSFDSGAPGECGIVCHTAFDDPERPPDGPPRHSIETRVLAFGG